MFRIPDRGITFQFGAEQYRFTKEHCDFSDARVPLSKTRDVVIAPFISAPFKQFTEQAPKAFGAHIRFADHREILLDYSLGYANRIFLQFSSELQESRRFLRFSPRCTVTSNRCLKSLMFRTRAKRTNDDAPRSPMGAEQAPIAIRSRFRRNTIWDEARRVGEHSDYDSLLKVAVQLPADFPQPEVALHAFDMNWWINNCQRSGGALVFDYEIQDGV